MTYHHAHHAHHEEASSIRDHHHAHDEEEDAATFRMNRVENEGVPIIRARTSIADDHRREELAAGVLTTAYSNNTYLVSDDRPGPLSVTEQGKTSNKGWIRSLKHGTLAADAVSSTKAMRTPMLYPAHDSITALFEHHAGKAKGREGRSLDS